MNEAILVLNGLSVEILSSLSYPAASGISLKRTLSSVSKDLILEDVFSMAKWLDEQEILFDLSMDYRIKSFESIESKYNRYLDSTVERCVKFSMTSWGSEGFVKATKKYWTVERCVSVLQTCQMEKLMMTVIVEYMFTFNSMVGIILLKFNSIRIMIVNLMTGYMTFYTSEIIQTR